MLISIKGLVKGNDLFSKPVKVLIQVCTEFYYLFIFFKKKRFLSTFKCLQQCHVAVSCHVVHMLEGETILDMAMDFMFKVLKRLLHLITSGDGNYKNDDK